MLNLQEKENKNLIDAKLFLLEERKKLQNEIFLIKNPYLNKK